jgi:hypothetical protein
MFNSKCGCPSKIKKHWDLLPQSLKNIDYNIEYQCKTIVDTLIHMIKGQNAHEKINIECVFEGKHYIGCTESFPVL